MASTCNTGCINDARVLVWRHYKWPESDAAFVQSVSSNIIDLRLHKRHSGPTANEQRQPWLRGRNGYPQRPMVVDGISCRQMYLRSYPFSRKESVSEKTRKCFGRLKERLRGRKRGAGRWRKCVVVRRAKEASCFAVVSILRRLLSCTVKCKDL